MSAPVTHLAFSSHRLPVSQILIELTDKLLAPEISIEATWVQKAQHRLETLRQSTLGESFAPATVSYIPVAGNRFLAPEKSQAFTIPQVGVPMRHMGCSIIGV